MAEWDAFNRPVQGALSEGQFLNAAYMLLAAGPPRLEFMSPDITTIPGVAPESIAYPIGILQTMNLGHNRAFTRLWEIGSEFSFYVPGRTVGQLNVGRAMYHGPSLLRLFYAYYNNSEGDFPVESLYDNNGDRASYHVVNVPPGYDNIWWNLASDIFTQPIGILIYVRDINKETVGAVYLEYCQIPAHAFATDAQGTVLQEMATVQFERAVPVNVATIDTMEGDADSIIRGQNLANP